MANLEVACWKWKSHKLVRALASDKGQYNITGELDSAFSKSQTKEMAFPPIISDGLQVGVTKLIKVWGQSTMTTKKKKKSGILCLRKKFGIFLLKNIFKSLVNF